MTAAAVSVRPASPGVPVSAVVLVLNGGQSTNTAPASTRNLAYQRMRPFARIVHRDLRGRGVAVWQLRYRVRGWNGAAADPVRDATWAIERIANEHPGVPVVAVGHSMGGRTALYVAGADNVVGVCALAPWIEPRDPVAQLSGRTLVAAHGNLDRMTDPRQTRRYASQAAAIGARVAFFQVAGEKHAMLRRPSAWHVLTRDAVRFMLDIPSDSQVARVMATAPADRLGVLLGAAA
ncbi:MAG TPA: alpha/beta fold hydrolase [Micromonosporaceae bacterium]